LRRSNHEIGLLDTAARAVREQQGSTASASVDSLRSASAAGVPRERRHRTSPGSQSISRPRGLVQDSPDGHRSPAPAPWPARGAPPASRCHSYRATAKQSNSSSCCARENPKAAPSRVLWTARAVTEKKTAATASFHAGRHIGGIGAVQKAIALQPSPNPAARCSGTMQAQTGLVTNTDHARSGVTTRAGPSAARGLSSCGCGR